MPSLFALITILTQLATSFLALMPLNLDAPFRLPILSFTSLRILHAILVTVALLHLVLSWLLLYSSSLSLMLYVAILPYHLQSAFFPFPFLSSMQLQHLLYSFSPLRAGDLVPCQLILFPSSAILLVKLFIYRLILAFAAALQLAVVIKVAPPAIDALSLAIHFAPFLFLIDV